MVSSGHILMCDIWIPCSKRGLELGSIYRTHSDNLRDNASCIHHITHLEKLKEMKKSIAFIIAIISIVVIAYFLINASVNIPANQTPSYTFAEGLNGLGCIKLGSSVDKVKQSLDSNYLNYRDVIRRNRGSIDYVKISRNTMLQYKGPSSIDTPDKYNTDYRRYHATIILSEELAVENVELYFWRDTLHRISLLNHLGTDDIGEAMIYRYGEGAGHKLKTASRTEQEHNWGNDLCTATYIGNITYRLNSQGIASGIDRWFHRIDITLRNERMNYDIKQYLERADSLYRNDKYKNI